MKLYIGITVGVLAVLACIGFLYSGNRQWTKLTLDLTLCIESKIEHKAKIDDLKREVARLEKEVEARESAHCPAVNCPTCPPPNCPAQEACPPCPTCVCAANPALATLTESEKNIKAPCWKNTPLYKPGWDCGVCDSATPANWPWPVEADLCSFISLGGCCKYRHFLGFDWRLSPQFGWADVMMIDFAFTAHQDLIHIVEFGTFVGVTSLYLGLLSHMRSGTFSTFDIADHRHGEVTKAWMPNMKHTVLNLLTIPPEPLAVEAASQSKTLFFFDNGDKPGECNRFLEYVSKDPSNVFCTHDWDIEVTLASLQEKLTQYGYVPWAHAHAEMLGSHVRCFRRNDRAS